MAVTEQDAIDIGLPIASAGTAGLTGVFCKAISTTAQRFQIPDAWKGCYVEFHAKGAEAQIAFGGSTVDVSLDEQSGVSSEVITFDVNTGYPIPADTSFGVRLPRNKTITHFSVDGSGAGFIFGFLRVGRTADGVTA